jgi:hypothetical protein
MAGYHVWMASTGLVDDRIVLAASTTVSSVPTCCKGAQLYGGLFLTQAHGCCSGCLLLAVVHCWLGPTPPGVTAPPTQGAS